MPFPPTVNHYWKTAVRKTGRTKSGFVQRTILSGKARTFRTLGTLSLKQQRRKIEGFVIIDYPVRVHLALHPATNARFDVDNYAKGVLDALTHARVWTDDSLVYELLLTKHRKSPPGRVVVTIEPM